MDLLTNPKLYEFIFAVLGIVGVFLVSIKRKSGFIWIGLGQVLFVFYFYYMDQPFLTVQNIILSIFNGYGYYYWTKKEKHE
jgi:nicotinamide riboside transporter PnuC